MSRAKTKVRRHTLPLHVIAIIVGVFMVIPVFYALLGGFKTNSELSGNPFGLPSDWITANYTDVLGSGSFWRQLWNSTFIAIATTVVTIALSALAAFVFARFAFRGRELYFTLFTAGLMFPFAVAILPIFVMLRTLGLLDNPLGVILTQAAFGLPLTIIILRGFFRSIPGEIEEAATIDGCSPFGFFWRILLPMARPAIATVSVLAIVGSWNNFMLPLVVFSEETSWTLPLGIQQFQGQYASDTARILAYLVLAMVPALGFYAIAERHLVGGLTAGATKG
ncbi:Maltose/maltodextrin ABC transporter, permease protein MalG [[Actinomadura] parvosata subsp. kistnae]|uniref:Thiamine ABC transporter ATP-binding protein n=1 Tax=[Actinomadura] parvosata subsp. kistnae TaxID=1909395 RepID=A0A1V0A868_9ACTN|nr:carbohydrate ABC transporter permease [Nonomuraea sp. ATCC 55076]AQZ66342.1 thiamine ABC transporter ATP-binding protein [Nonomuraea sp. ATCC 55076]SPL95636.1 Maltose/maltodextrin ABC transporter, permease protein MalG [Actinomadura parvosata subsp. kistnae]